MQEVVLVQNLPDAARAKPCRVIANGASILPVDFIPANGALGVLKEFQRIVGIEVPDLNLLSPVYFTIYNRRVHDHSLTGDGVEANFADVYIR